MTLTAGSLFSGIGGLDLGFERAGIKIAWQCEIDEFCRRVLKKHWPDVPCYEDIKEIDYDTPKVDILFGGFPCQPVSTAGRRKAEEDSRWLWPEFARVIGLLRPHYVLVENVPGLLTKGMGFILSDLSSFGYDAEWHCIPAVAFGAPHRRERVILVAYNDRASRPQQERECQVMGASEEFAGDGEDGAMANTDATRLQGYGGEHQLRETGQEEPSRGGSTDVAFPYSGRGGGASRDAVYKGRAACEDRGESLQKTTGRAAGVAESDDWTASKVSGYEQPQPWSTECRLGIPTHGLLNGLDCGGWECGVPRTVTGQADRVQRLKALGNAVVPAVAEYAASVIVQMENHAGA